MELWLANDTLCYEKLKNEKKRIKSFVNKLLSIGKMEYDLPFTDSYGKAWVCSVNRHVEFRRSRIGKESAFATEHSLVLIIEHDTDIRYSLRTVVFDDNKLNFDVEYFMKKLFARRCMVL